MDWVTIVGLAAGTLTTGCFIPQIIKIAKDKSAKEVSLLMFLIIGTGGFLWLIYGLEINSFPVIIANAISLVLIILVILLKLKYSKHKEL